MLPSVLFAVHAPDTLALQLGLVGVWLGLVVGCAEGLRRWQNLDPELSRKVVHIGVGNVILLAWWFQLPTWVGVTASVLFSMATLLSYRYPILASVSSVGRQSWGTFFYALSFGLLISWFWPHQLPQYAVIGILVMTWGDGLAALCGQHFGRHLYTVWGIPKSWEGSAAMAGVSFVIIALVLSVTQGSGWDTWGSAIAVSLIATVLEAFSKFGIDNLSVPLGSAALCYLFNESWLG